MYKWFYNGPVKEFDMVISEHWSGETMADTEKKARSNLTYQYKRQHNRVAQSRIALPGVIERR